MTNAEEPAVQVAASLIERIRTRVESIADHVACEYDVDDALDAMVIEVRALLSPPTPSGEPDLIDRLAELREPVNGHRPYCLTNQPGDGSCNCDTATPPSIADMAPGTTFVGRIWGESDDELWFCTALGVTSVTGVRAAETNIDPSTIRDVTPPQEQP